MPPPLKKKQKSRAQVAAGWDLSPTTAYMQRRHPSQGGETSSQTRPGLLNLDLLVSSPDQTSSSPGETFTTVSQARCNRWRTVQPEAIQANFVRRIKEEKRKMAFDLSQQAPAAALEIAHNQKRQTNNVTTTTQPSNVSNHSNGSMFSDELPTQLIQELIDTYDTNNTKMSLRRSPAPPRASDIALSPAKRARTNSMAPERDPQPKDTSSSNEMFGDDLVLPSESDHSDPLLPADLASAPKPVETLQKETNEQKTMNTALSDEMFGDDLFFDSQEMFGDDLPVDLLDELIMEDVPASAVRKRCIIYKRLMVIDVKKSKYREDNFDLWQQEISLSDPESDFNIVTILLRQDWVHTRIMAGDTVNITFTELGPDGEAPASPWIIDNTHHFLIQHPDVLISCTAVSDTFHCLRKSVLQQLTRQVHDFAEPLVVGDVIHRTLQHCLDIKDFAASTVRATFVTMIKLHHLGSLYVLDMEEATLLDHLVPYIDGIVTFGTRYVGKDPRRDAVITRDIGPSAAKKCDAVAIRNVIDIEEHLWSPAFGLKGMIDATVEMKLAPSNDIVTLPFELKTGKTNRLVTHRAQTILYTLMLSDRYGFNVEMGALYYTKVNALYLVPCLRNEIQSLLIARNDLAAALRNQATSLPPMVRNIHKCQYCAVRDACLTQHKAVEQGDADSSGLGQWFDDHTDHLTDKGMKFFRHWMNLIALEEKDTEDIRKDIWAMPADIRERHGRCLKNMELQPHATETAVGGHWHTFTRSSVDRERRSLLESSIMVGDPMVISSMDGDLHLGMGFVIAMDHASITISLSSPLRPQPRRAQGFDIEHCQTFVQWRQNPDAALVATRFRLDKDETSSGFQALKTNIVSLMAKQCGNETLDASHANLRRLIVDLEEPTFTLNDDSINAVLHTDPAILALNADQQNAVHQILTCRDYAMILGMPGTGKTTTIAEIIQVLVRHGKSVLLTAYTHNAVDNLLCKLLDKNVDFLRLGNPDKVLPQLHPYMSQFAAEDLDSVAAMTQFYNSKQVVATTCFGVNHIIFRRRRFDYCIVDEASQITLPVCIGPLQYADKFILVGDQYQLQPIVQDAHAIEGGYGESLFKILASQRPEAITYLKYQYRMNKDIMLASSELFYDAKLRCGNDTVANKRIQYPSFDAGIQSIHRLGDPCTNSTIPCWINHILDSSRAVIFANTDQVPARESRPNDRFTVNNIEASLVQQTVEALLACGMQEQELAVVSVYKTQLRLLNSQLTKKHPELEVATIDRYQGRDKECVLISLVRSNEAGNTGNLLRDWRRLNVAFTRAKSKLVVFGSLSTLVNAIVFERILGLWKTNNWIYDLPKGAHHMHHIATSTHDASPQRYRRRRNNKESAGTPQRHTGDHRAHDRPILNDINNFTNDY